MTTFSQNIPQGFEDLKNPRCEIRDSRPASPEILSVNFRKFISVEQDKGKCPQRDGTR
jgi:hypothetical protein